MLIVQLHLLLILSELIHVYLASHGLMNLHLQILFTKLVILKSLRNSKISHGLVQQDVLIQQHIPLHYLMDHHYLQYFNTQALITQYH